LLRISADRGGDDDRGRRGITTANRVLFQPLRQYAQLPRHQDRDRLVRDLHGPSSEKYEFGEIFSGLPLLDIHEYLSKGVRLEGVLRRAVQVSRPVPHARCRLWRRSPSFKRVDGCAGGVECALLRPRRGCWATSRSGHLDAGPLSQGGGTEGGCRGTALSGLRGCGQGPDVVSFRACRGLRAFDGDAATSADYIVVEIGATPPRPNWMADYVASANRGGIERVLVCEPLHARGLCL